jgi:transcriptional regulator with XRE-family HTH domain
MREALATVERSVSACAHFDVTSAPTQEDIERGARLAALRVRRGLSQEDVARELGVSVSTVSRWETGKQAPERNLEAMSEFWGVSVDSIVRGPSPGANATEPGDVAAAVADLVAGWDVDDGREPDDEELAWLRSFTFEEDRRAGLRVTAALLRDRLRARRRQRRVVPLAAEAQAVYAKRRKRRGGNE